MNICRDIAATVGRDAAGRAAPDRRRASRRASWPSSNRETPAAASKTASASR